MAKVKITHPSYGEVELNVDKVIAVAPKTRQLIFENVIWKLSQDDFDKFYAVWNYGEDIKTESPSIPEIAHKRLYEMHDDNDGEDEKKKHKFRIGQHVMRLNEEYEIEEITDHYILTNVKEDSATIIHVNFEQEEFMELVHKFNVSDWIVANDKGNVNQVNGFSDDGENYLLMGGNVDNCAIGIDFIDANYHLWSINDAKDGDVLVNSDGNVFIFRNRNPFEQATSYCGINVFGKFYIDDTTDCVISLDTYWPATKEQKEALFEKMKEAGYEWDKENKKLIKKDVPEFEVGKWYLCVRDYENFTKDNAYYCSHKGCIINRYGHNITVMNDCFRLWSINDAKDGDVLAYRDNQWIILFKQMMDENTIRYYALYAPDDKNLIIDDSAYTILKDFIYPATDRQRDMLFEKIHEAGYECDKDNKTLDKIEEVNVSPFKAGKWYLCIKDFFGKGVYFDKGNAYYCEHEGCLKNDGHISIVKELYNYFRPWTIQDAKDGDILVNESNKPFIFKGICDIDNNPIAYGGILADDSFRHSSTDSSWTWSECRPADEEQKIHLFKKMEEAHYIWDANKKKLSEEVISGYDLFDERPDETQMSEFDKKILECCRGYDFNKNESTSKIEEKYLIRRFSSELISIARETILAEEIELAYKTQDEIQYKNGFNKAIDEVCEKLRTYRRDYPDGTGYVSGVIDDETIEDIRKLSK